MAVASCRTRGEDFVIYLRSLAQKCIASERVRGLSERSLTELRRNLARFSEYARTRVRGGFEEITAETIKDFLLFANPSARAAMGKSLVWSMRKFFSFLALRQIIPASPARSIPHPKARPREKLPTYLKPAELAALLETAAEERSMQDFTVLTLLATVGARPHEIAKLRRERPPYR